jgi:hypothetical protein
VIHQVHMAYFAGNLPNSFPPYSFVDKLGLFVYVSGATSNS